MPESMNFSFAQLQLQLLIPMCISLLGGIILLAIGVFNKTKSRELYIIISILFVMLNLGFLIIETNPSPQFGFFNLLLVDGVSLLSQFLILFATLIVLLFFMNKNSLQETQNVEFYALLLLAIAGFGFMVSSENLILILLGLECASLSIYTLVALHNNTRAFESAIKYFVMGGLATALYAFGSLFLYMNTGSLELSHIALFLQEHAYEPSVLLLVGFIFLFCAFGFKISAVPFHTWTPDVYQSSNALLSGFIATAPKIAAFGVIIRIFSLFAQSHHEFIESILYIIIILTLSIPNLIALVQKDVKRMLAYSSISHSGFVLGAILIEAPEVVFLYWFFFLFANLGAFGILWLYIDCKEEDKHIHSFNSLKGMIKKHQSLGILLAFFMFTLAGIPPFSVFWGKLYLIQNVMQSGYIILALIMALNSVISAFYYLKVVIYIFSKDIQNSYSHSPLETSSIIALTITAFVSIGCIFMVQDLLLIVAKYIGSGF